MKKYKFILTLDEYTTFDSAVELEGLVNWPNHSQPYPEHYRGVFDTYEEAKEYAENFWLYKHITNDGYAEYFTSIFDVEDAVCDPICIHPDDYIVEEITEEDTENDIPAGVYKFCYIYEGERVFDSLDEWGVYYDSYDEAREVAESNIEYYEIPTVEYPSDRLYLIKAENVEIVEFDDEEV